MLNPDATSNCSFCPIADTNAFLKLLSIDYADRWRNFGLMWVYVVFNIFAAVGLYWLIRLPKKRKNVEVPILGIGSEDRLVQLRSHESKEGFHQDAFEMKEMVGKGKRVEFYHSRVSKDSGGVDCEM